MFRYWRTPIKNTLGRGGSLSIEFETGRGIRALLMQATHGGNTTQWSDESLKKIQEKRRAHGRPRGCVKNNFTNVSISERGISGWLEVTGAGPSWTEEKIEVRPEYYLFKKCFSTIKS